MSNNIIAQCLNYENDEELAFAKALAEKKLKTLSRFDKQKQNEKIASFLQRKGFSYELIKKVVNFERDY